MVAVARRRCLVSGYLTDCLASCPRRLNSALAGAAIAPYTRPTPIEIPLPWQAFLDWQCNARRVHRVHASRCLLPAQVEPVNLRTGHEEFFQVRTIRTYGEKLGRIWRLLLRHREDQSGTVRSPARVLERIALRIFDEHDRRARSVCARDDDCGPLIDEADRTDVSKPLPVG